MTFLMWYHKHINKYMMMGDNIFINGLQQFFHMRVYDEFVNGKWLL